MATWQPLVKADRWSPAVGSWLRGRIVMAIELSWLAALALVPLIVAHEQTMAGFIEMPKVAILRTVASVLAVLLLVEWSLAASQGLRLRTLAWWRLGPAGWLVASASFVLLANGVSAALSPVRSVSIWGIDPGQDTYALANVASFFVIFLAIATHLRNASQVRRLLWVVVAAALAASLYGWAQHYGYDPLRPSRTGFERTSLSFGNPLFAAAYLSMTVSLTLSLVLALRSA